jgi:hypothetical protein
MMERHAQRERERERERERDGDRMVVVGRGGGRGGFSRQVQLRSYTKRNPKRSGFRV